MISKQYRQGDVLLVAIDQPSRTGKQIDLESGRVILARGEIAAPNVLDERPLQRPHASQWPKRPRVTTACL